MLRLNESTLLLRMFGRHTRGAVRAKKVSALVLGWNVGMSIFSTLGVLALVIVGWTWLAPSASTLTNAISGGLFLGLCIGALILLGTCRVVARSGTVEVFNLLMTHQFGFQQIAEVDSDRGLSFVLRDGRRIQAMIYGESAWGNAHGYRGAEEVAERVVEYFQAAEDRVGELQELGSRYRLAAVGVALASISVFMLGLVVVHSLA